MRVALVGDTASVHVRRWAEEIGARGIEVLVVSSERPAWATQWAGLDSSVGGLRGLGLRTRRVGRQIRDICVEHGVDVLHVHYLGGLAHGAAESGVHPLVITVWGSDLLRTSRRSLRSRVRARIVLRRADLVMCGSRSLVDAAISSGADSSVCVEIGWGVDTTRFARKPDMRAVVREQLEVPEAGVLYVSNRHLEPLYRVGEVVDAFAIVHRTRADARLAVVGVGSQHKMLQDRVESLGLADSVRFLGRLPTDEDMAELLSAADILVSVPETDGGPISVLEAFASQLAVVASDISANREWVVPGVTGALWAGDGSDTLAKAMLAVIQNAPEFGRRGRDAVVERAERSRLMDAAVEYYRRLVVSSAR